MPRLLPLTKAALAAVTATGLLAGCSSAPPQMRAGVGHVIHVDVTSGPVCPDGEPAFTDGQGELIGPNFAFTVSCVRFGAELDALDLSDAYPDGERPLPPPIGHEYALIAFDDEEPATVLGGSGAQDAFIVFDEGRTELDDVPEPGDFIITVVPVGGAAALMVVDEGREQALDLRARTRINPVEAYYTGIEGTVDTPGYKMRADGASGGWTGWYSLNGDIQAERVVYSADTGWAADGRATLYLRVWWSREEKKVETYFELSPEKSMKVTSGGETYKPTSVDDAESNSGIVYTYTYDVPADVIDFDVVFQPRGRLFITDDGRTLSLTKKPKKNSFTVSFARD